MIKQYESMFVLTPVLSEEQVKSSLENIKKTMQKQKANIVHEEYWGMRALAYPIAHKSMGFYYLVEFLIETSAIDALKTEYNRDERIVRHMTVVLDKHAIAYNEKRRQKIAATAKEKAEEAAAKPVEAPAENLESADKVQE